MCIRNVNNTVRSFENWRKWVNQRRLVRQELWKVSDAVCSRRWAAGILFQKASQELTSEKCPIYALNLVHNKKLQDQPFSSAVVDSNEKGITL